MKITKSQLKQIIKEELEAAQAQVSIPTELKRISARFKVGGKDKTSTDLQLGQYKIHCPGGECELVYKNKFGVYFSKLGKTTDREDRLVDELMEKAGYKEAGRPDQPTTFVEGEVSDEVKARTPPKDKANKADFLPKQVRDKINKEAK